jgi:hypothetical protein
MKKEGTSGVCRCGINTWLKLVHGILHSFMVPHLLADVYVSVAMPSPLDIGWLGRYINILFCHLHSITISFHCLQNPTGAIYVCRFSHCQNTRDWAYVLGLVSVAPKPCGDAHMGSIFGSAPWAIALPLSKDKYHALICLQLTVKRTQAAFVHWDLQ